jgi:fructose-1,6-bisphosphatase-3
MKAADHVRCPDSAPTPERLAHLRALSAQYPTIDAAVSEAAALRATLSLPKGVIHVISDIHGENAKLRHVVNNASGALRHLVERVLGDRLPAAERARFLAVLYYPREAINEFSRGIVESGRRVEWVFETLSLQFEIIRSLRGTYRRATSSGSSSRRTGSSSSNSAAPSGPTTSAR